MFKFKSPQGQLARWLEELCQFSFTIQHRAGSAHSNADALSRIQEEGCDCYQAGSNPMLLPCQGCDHCVKVHRKWARFNEDVDDVVPLAARRVDDKSDKDTSQFSSCNWFEGMSAADLKLEQKTDKDLQAVYGWVKQHRNPDPKEVRTQGAAVRSYYLTRDQFQIENGVLYYTWIDDSGHRSQRLVVPRSLRERIIQACHVPAISAHQGEKRTIGRVKSKFF